VHKKVILIGCGNIGSRHLQALVKLPYEIDIQIVDPNENSQKLAKSRLNETEKNNAAKRPAVVPLNTLTSAKIMKTVNEPITAGNKIVKSYKEEFPPKI